MKPLLAACLLSTAVFAQAESLLGLRIGADSLSGPAASWEEGALQFTHRFGPRRVLDLELAHTERYALRDRRLQLAYTHPLTAQVAATLEGSVSDTHRVLAQRMFGFGVQVEFMPAWLLHAGLRTTRYDSGDVNQAMLMLERYVGSYSFSAAWRPARLEGTGASVGELRATRYYGERSSLGLIAAAGTEAESVGGDVILTSVRSLALAGRHWVAADWALTWSLGHTRQGDLYIRNGIQLGVQHAF